MQTIKNILSGNKNNSAESKVLDKIDLLSINYDDTVSIILNDKKIQLATVLAKLLADNENNVTNISWIDMLSKGFTNQNKMKSANVGTAKATTPLISKIESITMSASDFRNHKIGLYTQFSSELEVLLARYGVTCFDTLLTAEDIFEMQDSEEYQKKLEAEKVSQEVIDTISLPYDAIARNNGYVIVTLAESNTLSEVKHFVIDLEEQYLDVKRQDYTISFMESL